MVMLNPKLFRITTVPISLKLLLTGQMQYMSKEGFDVTMISAKDQGVKNIELSEEVPHHNVPFTRKLTPLIDLYCLLLLIGYFCKQKPTIVHTHTPKAGLLGMIAARITAVPLRVHTVAGLPLMTAIGWKKKLLIFTEKLTYWGAQHVLPNSNSILLYMNRHKLCNKNKLNIIGFGSTNGIDLNRFSTNSLDQKILKSIKVDIGYNENNIYILAVGRVVKDKGIIELIESFNLLQKEPSLSTVKLILLGPLENQRKEESLPISILNEIKNNDNIIHIEWSDHVEYFMDIAKILVHASHREGFPNVLLQSGAMGCPIVCSNIPGNIDIVRNNVTGILFEKGNFQDLTDKLYSALSKFSELSQYSNNLKAEIIAKYDRRYIHKQYLDFYTKHLVKDV